MFDCLGRRYFYGGLAGRKSPSGRLYFDGGPSGGSHLVDVLIFVTDRPPERRLIPDVLPVQSGHDVTNLARSGRADRIIHTAAVAYSHSPPHSIEVIV